MASLRSEPANYIRHFAVTAPTELVSLLTQARLVRVNRVDDSLEPALAERWEQSPDGRRLTFWLRKDITFSDGVPFTAADVLFSLAVAYDAPGSLIGAGLKVAGERVRASAPDPHTVSFEFAAPFAAGPRLLDNLPILPRHKLEAAFQAGTIEKAWTPATPLGEIAGLGPFVLKEHVAGQRMVFARNPRYWRRDSQGAVLPYLDTLTLQIIPDQSAEALRLESGATDLMSNGDIRPDDYARFKRLAAQGRLRLVDGGVGLDPNLLWFNLTSSGNRAKPWLRQREFRHAIALGVDRQVIVDTVYMGAAVPVCGPITPRNETWYAESTANCAHDPARARRLLAQIGLLDRDGDGRLEDNAGRPVRFSVLVQQGVTTRERTAAVLQDQLRALGIGVDVVGVDTGSMGARWMKGDYDAIFHGFQASATDPALNLDFWLSSGSMHVWNPGQQAPATAWERQIDELMRAQASTMDLAQRKKLFADVQRIFADNLPAIYFAAPRVTLALSPRVRNATPAPHIPQLLWAAETLAADTAHAAR